MFSPFSFGKPQLAFINEDVRPCFHPFGKGQYFVNLTVRYR